MNEKKTPGILHKIDPNVSADRIIATTRFLDAPPDLVFAAFTKPRHLSQWWLPRGLLVITHTLDLVPGGVWWFTVRRFDGYEFLQAVTYSAIEWGSALSYFEGDAAESDLLQSHITFDNAGGKTKLTVSQIFESVEARRHMEANQLVENSLPFVLDRLSECLTKIRR